MYPENGTNGIENSADVPQSPTVPHLRHHQPTTDDHNDHTTRGLKQRHANVPSRPISPGGIDSNSMRIQIQTPFSDLGESSENGRRKELVVDRAIRAFELKDGMAAGQWGNQGWIRDGMRLVWRGRIVRDEEELGQVVKDTSDTLHIFHMVARRIETGSSSRTVPPITRIHLPEPSAIPDASSSRLMLPPRDRATTALQDSLHYLYFMARHHLCHLLDAPSLAWEDTIPPPVVRQAVAREAVMSVVKGVAQARLAREEGWEDWEGSFDETATVEALDREGMETEMRGLWSSAVGRSWADGSAGEAVSVELDEVSYMLHLPPLPHMSSSHLSHLILYLRLTSLIPLFSSVVEHESRAPPQADTLLPTRTVPARPPPEQVRVLLRLRIPTIPMSVLAHMGYSAVKIAGMLWMLTRGMTWGDVRFWVLAGAAGGWWIADGFNAWNRENPRRPRPNPIAEGGPAVQGEDGAAQPNGQAAAGRAGVARPARPPTLASTTAFIPLLHLRTDAAQLGHPTTDLRGTTTSTPTRRQPPWIITQFALPFCLWFITLIPEWENIRARAIRRRERAMRVVVGEATAAAAAQDEAEGFAEEGEREHVYPEGLNAVAKRYYSRVMARGEGVDWEEEREAQRAMGIPDEDEAGDDMRMRML